MYGHQAVPPVDLKASCSGVVSSCMTDDEECDTVLKCKEQMLKVVRANIIDA